MPEWDQGTTSTYLGWLGPTSREGAGLPGWGGWPTGPQEGSVREEGWKSQMLRHMGWHVLVSGAGLGCQAGKYWG